MDKTSQAITPSGIKKSENQVYLKRHFANQEIRIISGCKTIVMPPRQIKTMKDICKVFEDIKDSPSKLEYAECVFSLDNEIVNNHEGWKKLVAKNSKENFKNGHLDALRWRRCQHESEMSQNTIILAYKNAILNKDIDSAREWQNMMDPANLDKAKK